MPNRSTLNPTLRRGLALCLCAVAFGWGQVPAAAAPAEPLAPAIQLDVTVGTDASVCAATTSLNLPVGGGEVTYCYEVTNTGDVDLELHDLEDSELGTLLNDFPYTLPGPGASAFLTATTTLTATTVSTAIWTAFNDGPQDVSTATGVVTVTVDAPAISLNITVGTNAGVCPTTSALDLTAPAEVTYCYEVVNTGQVTLTSHTLVNSISGVLLNNFPYELVPGASAFLTDTAMLTATRVTSATWTAYNDGPVDIAISTDTAAVNIGPLFGCNAPPRTFETGLPGSWAVDDLSPGGAGIDWTTTADTAACGHGNLTNGLGEAACADSDQAGEPSDNVAYDTALLTNHVDLTHAISTTLHLSAFYSDLAPGNDLFRIEVWNGKGWFTELTWDEEHSNEDIDLDLSTYDGVAEVRIRFRYSGPGWDWYAQVDDVWLSCGGRTYVPLALK